MAATLTLGQIRPFTAEDIPPVAGLHIKVTGRPDDTTPEFVNSCRKYLSQVFLDNPWRDEEIRPLVHQEDDGRISGFIGIIPRPMSLHGKLVRAALLCEFVVDPKARGFTGLNLLRAALAGPQDLSYSDQANLASRKLVEGLGGATSYLYSTRWTHPVRPFEFGRYYLKEHDYLTPRLLSVSRSIAPLLDRIAERLLKNAPAPPSCSRLVEEDLACETLLACWAELPPRYLRPDYDHAALSWLLARAGRKQRKKPLHRVLLRTEKQEIAGWYLYHAIPRRPARVVQLYAKPRFARAVLEHLFHHAWQQGAIAVTGRLEPDIMDALSQKHCLYDIGPDDWMVVHSRRPELVRAFERGEVRISQLEGEPGSPFGWQ